MIKRNQHSKMNAFTIFEVTVVLAIMSVLITIIFTSLNRFNERLKIANDISMELNSWRSIRSAIWRECYTADSMSCRNNELHLNLDDRVIQYKVQDDNLHRRQGDDWVDLKINAEAIYPETKNEVTVYHIDFLWKQEVMALSYHDQPAIAARINNYFNDLE